MSNVFGDHAKLIENGCIINDNRIRVPISYGPTFKTLCPNDVKETGTRDGYLTFMAKGSPPKSSCFIWVVVISVLLSGLAAAYVLL